MKEMRVPVRESTVYRILTLEVTRQTFVYQQLCLHLHCYSVILNIILVHFVLHKECLQAMVHCNLITFSLSCTHAPNIPRVWLRSSTANVTSEPSLHIPKTTCSVS